MKNIKFRVWDIKNKNWREKDFFVVNPFDSINDIFVRKEFVFQLFTEQIDSKLKEIYEGDLIQYRIKGESKIRIAEVYWSEEFSMFMFDRLNEFNFMDWGVERSSIVVLGNLFENKELLETEKN